MICSKGISKKNIYYIIRVKTKFTCHSKKQIEIKKISKEFENKPITR